MLDYYSDYAMEVHNVHLNVNIDLFPNLFDNLNSFLFQCKIFKYETIYDRRL